MLGFVHQIPVMIDRASPVPLYHQLAEQLTAAVEDGTLQPGDPFENELALADRLDLSRPTVRRAIAELVSRGLLVRRRGVGTAVASEVIHRRDELTSLFEDMERKGKRPITRVLDIDRHSVTPRAAAALNLPQDTPLFYVERLRLAGDIPTALMHNWLPPQFADITEGGARLRQSVCRVAGSRGPPRRRPPDDRGPPSAKRRTQAAGPGAGRPTADDDPSRLRRGRHGDRIW
jgi:DNA-binding GntR family transcriptional regulator